MPTIFEFRVVHCLLDHSESPNTDELWRSDKQITRHKSFFTADGGNQEGTRGHLPPRHLHPSSGQRTVNTGE